MELCRKLDEVLEYIEQNLTESINYAAMAEMLFCSVYELSRIFPYFTGMSISEYIRKRKLSQAVFDLQIGDIGIIDIALKYGYDSQSSFSRAFKDMHGVTPAAVRKNGIKLNTFPKVAFEIKIKGAEGMKFRIEEKESFTIVGLKGLSFVDCDQKEGLNSIWNEFMDGYNRRLYNGGGENNYYTDPYQQVAMYEYEAVDGKTPCTIGAELKNKPIPEGMDTSVVPASKWAVFTFRSPTGLEHVPAAYSRIHTEWFPISGYERDRSKPNLEVFPPGDVHSGKYEWEIWMPIK